VPAADSLFERETVTLPMLLHPARLGCYPEPGRDPLHTKFPPGACVVSNGAAYTIAADRFYSDVPGCPAVVDPLGTMIAMTAGRNLEDTAAQLQPAVTLWETALDRAQYVWLTSGPFQEIPWNRPLNGYFTSHFRLIGLAGEPAGHRYVPKAGLYARDA
jgi:hypothetical protein